MPKPALVIAIPNSRRVFMEWAMSLCHMDIPINTSVTRMWTQPDVQEVDGKLVKKIMPVDEARNFLVEKSLEIADENGFIFFLDDDVLVPRDTLPKLMYELWSRPDVSAIAGIYMSKTDPVAPTIALNGGAGPHWDWRIGEVFECPFVATGCLLIRLKVFRTLSRPWFKTIKTWGEAIDCGYIEPSNDPLNTRTSALWVTDDYFWSTKMQKAGLKVMAHGGVLPLHVDDQGRCYGLPPNSLPTQPRSVVESSAKGGK